MGKYELRLPELGEGLHEGRIGKWLVKPGDMIKEDDPVAEVENDKSLVELPSPVDGKVISIEVAEGTVSVVGDVLLVMEVEGAGNASETTAPAAVSSSAQSSASVAPAVLADVKTAAVEMAGLENVTDNVEAARVTPATATTTAPTVAPAPTTGTKTTTPTSVAQEVLATPGVRKYAREQNVDLTEVTGSGSHGKITRDDVDTFLSGTTAEAPGGSMAGTGVDTIAIATQHAAPKGTTPVVAGPEPVEIVPLTTIRKRISEAMAKSAYTAPHVTIMDEVNVTELVALRQELKPLAAERGTKITYLPFIVKALIAAVRLHPELNATLDEEQAAVVLKKYYHIGIATDTERGLLVPVIRHADQKNMWSIASAIEDLATRGRNSKLGPNELKGSTISITNIGSAGGMFFTPIINFPEVAILGVGRITERLVMQDGQVVGAQMMALSMSFDHRIIDGALAQHAMNDIKRLLENPRLLLMEV